MEFVVLPADSVVGAGELLLRDFAVDFDHGALHEGDVLFFGQGAQGSCRNAGLIRCEEDAGAGRVKLVARVAHVSDSGDVDRAAAA